MIISVEVVIPGGASQGGDSWGNISVKVVIPGGIYYLSQGGDLWGIISVKVVISGGLSQSRR